MTDGSGRDRKILRQAMDHFEKAGYSIKDGRMVDAQGQPQPRVFILGSLRIGCVWESIAIPELRGQADTAVRGLLATPAA